MLVEHVFVTTSPADEALGTAARFLAERGFIAEGENGFAVGSAAAGVAVAPAAASAPAAIVVPAGASVGAAAPPPLPVGSPPPLPLPLPAASPEAPRPSWNALHLRR